MPGCICYVTVVSGTVEVQAEGESIRLMERDGLRFAADQPHQFVNMSHSAARMLLSYRYLK